jgi:hypothetical protein
MYCSSHYRFALQALTKKTKHFDATHYLNFYYDKERVISTLRYISPVDTNRGIPDLDLKQCWWRLSKCSGRLRPFGSCCPIFMHAFGEDKIFIGRSMPFYGVCLVFGQRAWVEQQPMIIGPGRRELRRSWRRCDCQEYGI